MIKNIAVYIVSIAMATSFVACGSKSDDTSTDNEEIVVVESDGVETTSSNDRRKMSVAADSMALYADDLSASQALTVLSTFYRVHLDARANGERRKDIQTMRKFIDVYDIVMSNHRDELRKMMLRAYEADTTLNLPGAIDEFRRLLDDYDSAHGQGGDVVEQKPDTVAEEVDSPKLEAIEATINPSLTEEPVEFRPAR